MRYSWFPRAPLTGGDHPRDVQTEPLEEGRHVGDDEVLHGGVSHDSAPAYLAPARLELRLDERYEGREIPQELEDRGMTSFSEMNETSKTAMSQSSGTCSRDMNRALTPSRQTTRGSFLRRQWSWP